MSTDYHLVTTWRVAGTVAEVRAVLSDPLALPRWWPAVYRSARLLREPGADGRGGAVELHTAGWLPYSLRWVLEVTEPMTDTGAAIRATGDLVGTGRWSFTVDGSETVVTYDWRVHAAKPLLRHLSWLLRPVFAANHRWAMARGQEALAVELRRRRGD